MELDPSAPTTATNTDTTKAKMEVNRRPMNAFLLFCKRHRAIVREVYPNLENRHITKILGEFWGSLSQEEKLPFNDLAATYKDHLTRENPKKWQQKLADPSVPLNPALDHEEKSDAKSGQGSSGSSSPEPGSSSAPKPFKKRYLAAEKAKISGESSERKSACEALLKLAEGSQGGGSSEKIKESTAAVTNGSSKSNPYDKVKESAQFTVLRQAVWTRVAKTILTQEEEKGKVSNHDDKPINLSSQCLIPNSTIIEHIIENIINDNDESMESAKSSDVIGNTECSEQIKEKIYQSLKEDITRRTVGGAKAGSNDLTALWKMLPNPIGGVTKKNGVQADGQAQQKSSIKKAHSAPASQSGSGAPSPKGSSSEPAVSVTLVTTESDLPLNLSKTPPQTPSSSLSTGIAITITTSSPAKRKLLDDEDDDLRRSSRACKGRRYQEFKDAVGRRGRGKAYMGKSDGESSQHSEDEQSTSSTNRGLLTTLDAGQPGGKKDAKVIAAVPSTPMTAAQPPSSAFDLEKALMNIPALRPEEFQRRIQLARQQQRTTTTHMSPRGTDTPMDTEQVTNNSRRTKSAARPPSTSESTLVVSAHGR